MFTKALSALSNHFTNSLSTVLYLIFVQALQFYYFINPNKLRNLVFWTKIALDLIFLKRIRQKMMSQNLSNVSNDLFVFRKKALVKSHFLLKTICHGQTIEKRINKLYAECVVNQLDHNFE